MQGYLHTESFEICLPSDYVLSRWGFDLEKKICVILRRIFVAGQSDVSHGVFRLPEPSCADDTWREDSEQSTHKSASHKNTGIARTHSGTHWNTLEHMVGISKHREGGNRVIFRGIFTTTLCFFYLFTVSRQCYNHIDIGYQIHYTGKMCVNQPWKVSQSDHIYIVPGFGKTQSIVKNWQL